MIKIYFGLGGSGKTYHATKDCVKAMKKGRPVFSNYPIVFTWRNKLYSSYELKKEDIETSNFPEGALICLDEAGLLFNSRKYKEFDVDSLMAFSCSRHMGWDFICISQNFARLDLCIRELAHEFIEHRKLWFLFFTETFYYADDVMLDSKMRKYSTKLGFYFFQSKYAKAYDTTYYKKFFMGRKMIEHNSWSDILDKLDSEYSGNT